VARLAWVDRTRRKFAIPDLEYVTNHRAGTTWEQVRKKIERVGGLARSVTVHVLGPLEVRDDDQLVRVEGTKPRAVLCLLGLHAGRVVPGETLVDVLWGDDPPRTAHKALQTHVSSLRRSLGDGVVLTMGSGWQLNGVTTDVERFDAAVAAGRAASRAGDPAAAVASFDEALDVWRGRPELPATPKGQTEAAGWFERRDAVVEERVDALLARGDAAELIGELEAAVAEAPLRERRWSQLMLALYRAGRQADALTAYQRARSLLDDQLGVAPGPELSRLFTAVLNHDPELAPPQPAPAPRATGLWPRSSGEAGGLPVQRTTFVGRTEELRRIDEGLRRQVLVTVVGPGGVGKTRLAIAAADAAVELFRSGVVFVDLVPVGPGFVVQAVAAALGIAERPQQPLADAVREKLARGRWLLVVDNCEHVLSAVASFVDELTAACPGVVVLATSRERLGARGERIITVPPLAVVSAETGEAKGSDAVILFLDRARAVAPDFDPDPALVGEVCARLDGVPLAIELAAARSGSLGIDGVLATLDDRMRLLTGRGATERHRSLRAVLDWSHELLDDEERAVFRRVAVFAGGFDLDAAVAVVCSEDDPALGPAAVADLVGRLAEKNLLAPRRGQTRSSWRLLEIVRVYARERLAVSGEDTDVRVRHLRWAARMAERLEQRLLAGTEWRTEFDGVVDDLRTGLTTAGLRTEGNDVGYRLAMALGRLSYARGFLAEARQHYQTAAAHAGGRAAADALRSAAGVAFAEMRHHIAYDLLLDAAQRSAEVDDQDTRAMSIASAVVLGRRHPGGFPEPPDRFRLIAMLEQARATVDDSILVRAHLAAATAWTANPARARCDGPLGEVALELAREADDPVLVSAALDGVTTVALGEGRFRDAAALARERLELLDRLARHDPRGGGEIIDIFHMVTETALATGDLPGALATALQARDDALGSGVRILATSRLVLPFALSGAFPDALGEATEMWSTWERTGKPAATWMAPAVYAAALACGLTGDQPGFRTWAERALAVANAPEVQGFAPFVKCRVALHDGRLDDAVATADALPAEYMGKFDAYARAIAAECAVTAGLPNARERLDAAAALAEQNDWAAACLLRARGRLNSDRADLERAVLSWEKIGAQYERACTLLLIDDRAADGRAELVALGCPVPSAR